MTEILPRLFSPLKIGRLEIKNRIVMTPAATNLSEAAMLDFYAARVRGGVGLIQLSPGNVDPAIHYDLATILYDDRFVPTLTRLVDDAHAHGAVISIQLWHGGRQVPSRNVVAPSPVAWSRYAPVPRELTIPEIEELVDRFAQAALRARRAGVDFVEVHAAHGYLVSEFLSPWSNRRMDRYGGDVTGRTRFAVEIIRRIKEVTGGDFPVSCRINGSDNVRGGLTLDDAMVIAPILVKAGLDLISVSAGANGSYPTIIPPCDVPHGCYVHLAAGVKSVVGVPVISTGRINDPRMAEDILKTGKADLIGMVRALVADPDMPEKARRGEFDEIQRCIGCNACIDSELEAGPIRCTVNPVVGKERELEITPAKKNKMVMVIGGGPAGMQAAIVAAGRGHHVTLYEKEAQLGGQWRLAAVPPHKEEFLELTNYQSRRLVRLGVEVRLGEKVTVFTVQREGPDVVIVATGAVPLNHPEMKLSGKVVTARDALDGSAETGSRVLVVGAGSVGLETAYFLASQGKRVTVIEMTKKIGADMGITMRYHLLYQLKSHKVRILTATRLKQVSEPGIMVVRDGSEEVWTEFDTVVLAIGARSSRELADALKGMVKELYVIGDAVEPRKGADALLEGAAVACRI